MWDIDLPIDAKPLGYKKLVDLFKIKTVPHFRWSYVSSKWDKKEMHSHTQSIYVYPCSYRLSENIFDHLEFALKHEGVNFFILKRVIFHISPDDFIEYLAKKPTGRYARILWYLYETFTQTRLSIPDLTRGSYVSLLDPDKYYTAKSSLSRRHRVSINLLGCIDFSPIIRKTSLLETYESKELEKVPHTLMKRYDASLLARAMKYLYTKETMSSWEIERETPDHTKLAKFVNLLYKADSIGALSEEMLVELQKNIVDPRFASQSYRNFQNYVGEEPALGQLLLHYISPKPADVPFLMQSLIKAFQSMESAHINPLVATAVLSFGFVYIHPFEDGNGRMHRFLIHYALARLKFTPEGIVFPVSAAIARDQRSYDRILEIFSRPLLEMISYVINEEGALTVLEDSLDCYRYIDFTPVAEYLFECVEKTITTDFQSELDFLVSYDTIKRLCKEVVDMPDQKLDLFIKCVRQNQGKISLRKRESYFSMLTDDEVTQMEYIISNPF